MELKVLFLSAFLLCLSNAAPAKKSEDPENKGDAGCHLKIPAAGTKRQKCKALTEAVDPELERKAMLANAMETAYSVMGFCRLYNLFDGTQDNFEPCVLSSEKPTAEDARECFVFLVLKTYPDTVHEDIFKCMGG